MSSRDNKRTMHEKLQLLRSVTSSQAVNDISTILDATKYIKELQQKVERLIHEDNDSQSVSDENSFTQVTVETLEKGLAINVSLERNYQGLLVAILEAIEDLGLDIHKARVSCAGAFHLEAIGEEAQGQVGSMSVQVVKQAVLQAMDNCRKVMTHEQP